jgi:RHS repeat-associated protein
MLTQLTSGGNTYTYRYDGLGNRVARIENSVEKRYVSGLAETDASGNITAYYVYGLGLISKITPSNQSYFYHFDGIGSTVGISDSSGNMVNKYAYDAFGKVLAQDEGIPNPFKYVGGFGVMDEGNGLFYMRARYYDFDVGRFISKDPIGFAGGLNLYFYTSNNPINSIDPLGLTDAIEIPWPTIWPIIEPVIWRIAGIASLGIIVAGIPGDTPCLNEKEHCYARWQAELEYCATRPARWWRGCNDRARDRYRLCLKGLPEPPAWGPADEETWRNPWR